MSNNLATDCRRQIYRRGQRVAWLTALKGNAYDPTTNYYVRGGNPGESKSGYFFVRASISDTLMALFSESAEEIIDPTFGVLPIGTATIGVMPDECPLSTGDRIVQLQGRVQSSNMMVRTTVPPTRGWLSNIGLAPATVSGPLSIGRFTWTGATDGSYNTDYTERGLHSGKPYYVATAGTPFIYWDTESAAWYAGPSLGTVSDHTYKALNNSNFCPILKWVAVSGANPTVTTVNLIAYLVASAGDTSYNGYYIEETPPATPPIYQLVNLSGTRLLFKTAQPSLGWGLGVAIGDFHTYTFSGAGTSAYNGGYRTGSGLYNGKPAFGTGGGHYLYWDTGTARWYLSTVLGSTSGAYTNSSNSQTPPLTGWALGTGAGPAPTATESGATYNSALVLDPLPIAGATSILAVIAGTQTFTQGTDYQLLGNSVQWLSGGAAPVEGEVYSARFTYAPTFEYLGLMDTTTWPDETGALMPTWGAIRLLKPDENNVVM